VDQCTACDARLIWAITPGGAKSPIDHDPSEQGNVLLLAPTGLGEVLAVVLSARALGLARARGLELRCSHFVTCPNREEFRKR
jgi:hypothetical protein